MVVSLGDRELTRGRVPIASDRWTTIVPKLPPRKRLSQFLPAVDIAVAEALRHRVDVLIHLAVESIPDPRLLEVLAESCLGAARSRPSICYPAVTLLSAAPAPGRYPVATDLAALAAPSPAESHPPTGPDPVAALTAAFATTPETWAAVSAWLPAWCPQGGSPADLVGILEHESVDLVEVPGATAYSQHPSGASLTFGGSPRTVALRDDTSQPWGAEAAG